ncbi:reverse transcriptase domain-containing protein [Tanacetum coccineum]
MHKHIHEGQKCSLNAKIAEEETGSQGPKRKSQALRKTTCLNHGCARKLIPSHPGSATLCSQKRPGCYDRSDDPEDHLKIFQATAKVKHWEMPTWCHMFKSTLTGSARVWFDDLPPESVDSYDDLKKAFLANFLQQKKCTKDPVEIHHIKQREGESTEEFVQRFKAKSRHVKGAPECMRIFGFMHAITNPKLIKRLHDKIPKSVDEMMRVTTSFLKGEVATSYQARKKALPAWKQQEPKRKQNFDKRGDFQNQQRSERRRDKFTLLIKSLRKLLALDKGKFKTPPPMTTPVEKRNNNKFCEFHGEVGHNTDECMHLKRQIEKLIKAGKLSHDIRKGLFHTRCMWDGRGGFLNTIRTLIQQDPSESKKLNCPGHHTPHWFQRRNHMDNGANITTGEDREGRGGVRKIQAVPSTAHGMLKFPVSGGIVILRSSKIIPLGIRCTMVSQVQTHYFHYHIRFSEEERIKVSIHPEYPKQTIAIGSTLTEEGHKELCGILRRNLDISVLWKSDDMTGVLATI